MMAASHKQTRGQRHQRQRRLEAQRPIVEVKTSYTGLYVSFIVSGELCDFNFSVFLVTMTVSLGLVATSRTLTELLLKYVLKREPEHEVVYKKPAKNPATPAASQPRNSTEGL